KRRGSTRMPPSAIAGKSRCTTASTSSTTGSPEPTCNRVNTARRGTRCAARSRLPIAARRSVTRPSSTSWHATAWSSAQLAVLAAAPVVAAVFLFVALFGCLAGDAQPYPGHGLPARLRNRRIALLATQARRPLRQLAARTLDAVLHG